MAMINQIFLDFCIHGCRDEYVVQECDEFRLLLRESVIILLDDPPLNRYVKSIPLELF